MGTKTGRVSSRLCARISGRCLCASAKPYGRGAAKRAVIAAGLVLLDHLPAAARVAGDRGRRQRRRLRHQPGIDQRAHEQDEAGRVAARVGDALRRAKPRALIGASSGRP